MLTDLWERLLPPHISWQVVLVPGEATEIGEAVSKSAQPEKLNRGIQAQGRFYSPREKAGRASF